MTEAEEKRNLFDITANRMYSALSAFYMWKGLSQAININTAGEEEAKKKVEIMNQYRYFFHQVLVSAYKSFVADLSIFFDREGYKDTFSLGKLLKILEEELTGDELNEITQQVNQIKGKHGVTINFIRELRNADVAHQTLQVQSRKVVYDDIEKLFSGVQEILNLISYRYDRSRSLWSHVERDVLHHLNWLFDNLERGEKVRLMEIDQKYKNL
ncbi:MAG TPA: hypothetical protein VGA94_05670 [Thermodesulfobacteriota bacterium]